MFFGQKDCLSHSRESFICFHDNIKQIMIKFHNTEICACSHTRKGRWLNIWYNGMILKLGSETEWNQTQL